MARPSPFHPNGFRHSPQTQNPYGVTKASPSETYTKMLHLRNFVQSAKFVNFCKTRRMMLMTRVNLTHYRNHEVDCKRKGISKPKTLNYLRQNVLSFYNVVLFV